MKKIILLAFFLMSYSIANAQFEYKKFYFSAGLTGQFMSAPKYSGFDINLTAIPRYNIKELTYESTLSIEARPEIGVGFRNWNKYREYDDIFPTRISYSLPILLNYNWGLNSEEDSLYNLGFYFGGGGVYSNVISTTEPPYYDPIYGFVIDAGFRINSLPVTELGFMYTIGNDGSRIYSVGLYFFF